MTNSGDGMYVISHEAIGNNSFMGDNRIPRETHFCRDCFGKYIAPLFITPPVQE